MKVLNSLSLVFFCFIFQGCDSGGGSSSGVSSVSSQSAGTPKFEVILPLIGESSSLGIEPEWFPKGVVESLPVMNVYTDDSEQVISKEEYKLGTYSVTNSETVSEGAVKIRGRGNSTWDWDKKPYKLKLTESTQLLGMPKSKRWVLLANHADKTLIRNDVAFMFSRSLNMAFTPRDRHVELHFNGAYQGVYQLVDQIRIDNDRVNIDEMDVGDTEDSALTGGYLLEVDFRMGLEFCQSEFSQQKYPYCTGGVNNLRASEFCLDSNYGMEPFCLKDPENLLEPEWAAQREYIEGYFSATEEALFGQNFTDPELGYNAYLDVNSAIDYYIINELFKNADGAVASAFFYKKREGKLFFGPIWDFDLALGNAGYNNLDKTTGWHIRNASWYDRLFQDPAFDLKVKSRWAELKNAGKLDQIFEYAKARALWLDSEQAKNFSLWPIFDWETWYTRIILGSYQLEVKEMIRWQHARTVWMDSQLSL